MPESSLKEFGAEDTSAGTEDEAGDDAGDDESSGDGGDDDASPRFSVMTVAVCSLEDFRLLILEEDLLDDPRLSPIVVVGAANAADAADAKDATEAEVGPRDAMDEDVVLLVVGAPFFRRNMDFPRGKAGKILAETAPRKRSL